MNSFDSLICCFYSPVYWGLSGLRWFSDLSWIAVSLGLKSCQHIWQLMLAVCWALSWSWQPGYLQVVSPTWLGFPHSMTSGFKNECPKSTRWKMDNLLWPSPKSHINSIRHVLVTSLNRFKRGIFSVVMRIVYCGKSYCNHVGKYSLPSFSPCHFMKSILIFLGCNSMQLHGYT